ncbi:O-antigen polymerase, partial [Shewanella sp. 10N.261.52.F9]|uniref:O-antigen polymerase n=1 Tax=Shewanella sp. 10N.261.52.F9 TaxID=3229684 RepID=UPI00354EE81D
MSKLDFWLLFFDNPYLYYSVLFSVMFLSFILLKLCRFEYFHPVVFFVFFNYQFALVGVIYLDILGYIESKYAYYFYMVQALFWIGFFFSIFIVSRLSVDRIDRFNSIGFNCSTGFNFSYKLSCYIYIFSILVTYIAFGIPLFENSKWSVFSSIPLAGIIGRLGSSTYIFIIVFITIKVIRKIKLSYFDKFIIFILLVTGLLSGSKMFFLSYFFIYYLVHFLFGIRLDREKVKKVLFLSTLFFVVVLGGVFFNQLYTNGTTVNPLQLVVQRLAMSGDMQILSLPNGYVDQLYNGEDILSILFFELKGLFSIFGVQLTGPSLGVKVMHIHYPYLKDNIGPSSTFDIFNYVYFNYFSYVISIFIGIFVGFFAKYRPRLKNEAHLIFYTIIAIGAYTLIYNPQIWISTM